VPGKSPGEVAFHWPERRILIVGDAVIGNPPGACGFLREEGDGRPAAPARQRARAAGARFRHLARRRRRRSIVGGAKERLRALCESAGA
jgi:glyoxylase-like metal-dependent hydrolase (beta-lactamase superfamily II)